MHKTSKGGTYRIDRVFPGIGRIALNSGATTRAEYDARNAMLSRLYEKPQYHPLLRRLLPKAAQALTVHELRTADVEERLDDLLKGPPEPDPLARAFWPLVDAWTPPGVTGKRYRCSLRQLRRANVLVTDAPLSALALVNWHDLRATWPASPADWNHVRRAVSHFLTDHLDELHPFRVALFRQGERKQAPPFPKAKEPYRVPDLTAEMFWMIVQATPEHVQAAYVAIVALGARVSEYLALRPEHLMPATCGVRLHGTKTAESDATVFVSEKLWPWVIRAVPAPVHYGWLRKYWKRALKAVGADQSLRLHDLRHLHGQLLSDAGVSESRIQHALRHASPDMTRRYTDRRDKGEAAAVLGNVLLPDVPLSKSKSA